MTEGAGKFTPDLAALSGLPGLAGGGTVDTGIGGSATSGSFLPVSLGSGEDGVTAVGSALRVPGAVRDQSAGSFLPLTIEADDPISMGGTTSFGGADIALLDTTHGSELEGVAHAASPDRRARGSAPGPREAGLPVELAGADRAREDNRAQEGSGVLDPLTRFTTIFEIVRRRGATPRRMPTGKQLIVNPSEVNRPSREIISFTAGENEADQTPTRTVSFLAYPSRDDYPEQKPPRPLHFKLTQNTGENRIRVTGNLTPKSAEDDKIEDPADVASVLFVLEQYLGLGNQPQEVAQEPTANHAIEPATDAGQPALPAAGPVTPELGTGEQLALPQAGLVTPELGA